jgi:hypothetical protein
MAEGDGATHHVGPVFRDPPDAVALETLVIAEDRRASRPGDYELIASVAGSHPNPVMRAKGGRASAGCCGDGPGRTGTGV